MTLGERIRIARNQAKLTQYELADRIGVSQASIHMVETGRFQSFQHTATVAQACGVDPTWLETGSGEMSFTGVPSVAASLPQKRTRNKKTPQQTEQSHQEMSLGERVKVARKYAKLSGKELAIRVGISDTAIYHLEKRGSKFSFHATSIAMTCGVDPIWLDTGRGEMSLLGSTPGMSQAEFTQAAKDGSIHRAPIFARLPLISWEDASRLCEEPAESFHPKAEAWLPIAPKGSDRTFALRVQDDSMVPEFQEGEFILIDPTLPGKHNQFIVARVEGDTMATFKQLMVVGSRTYLKPLNSRYPLIDVQGDIKVCGVVVGKFKEY